MSREYAVLLNSKADSLPKGNSPFLTPCVEIKKANLYRGFHESILGRFSNAAVDSKVDTSIESPLPRKQKVTWPTNGLRRDFVVGCPQSWGVGQISSKPTSGPRR